MDADRFDTLTKTLIAHQTRRATLRLLSGLTLHGPLLHLRLADAAAKKKGKGKKKCGPCKRRKKGRCTPKPNGTSCPGGTCQQGACRGEPSPGEAFERCMEPALAAFEAVIMQCEPQCGDVNSAACRSCREPGVDAAVAAADACATEACLCDVSNAPAESNNTKQAKRAVRAEGAGCDKAELEKCLARSNRDLGPCLFAVETMRELLACLAENIFGFNDCIEDFGCKIGYCRAGDVCCPRSGDVSCNGACCDTDQCVTCVGGVCNGCELPARCGSTPSGSRVCQCPSIAFTRCGDKKCCDTRACQTCVDGACQSKCGPEQVCRGELFPTCECPEDDEECDKECCKKDKNQTCCRQLNCPATCRRPVDNGCGACEFKCGGQCCNYASFNSCRIDEKGKHHCNVAGTSC